MNSIELDRKMIEVADHYLGIGLTPKEMLTYADEQEQAGMGITATYTRCVAAYMKKKGTVE